MVCRRPGSHFLLIGFVLLGCTELGAQRPAVQRDGVFVEIGPPAATSSVIPAPGTLRERLVRIDLDRLEAARASVGEASAGGSATLLLNLFGDARFAARAEHTGPTATGYVLSGPLVSARGTATLVVNGDVVAGTVRAPGGTYEIRSIGDGVHVIRQVDPTAFQLPRDDAVLPPPLLCRGPAIRLRPGRYARRIGHRPRVRRVRRRRRPRTARASTSSWSTHRRRGWTTAERAPSGH